MDYTLAGDPILDPASGLAFSYETGEIYPILHGYHGLRK